MYQSCLPLLHANLTGYAPLGPDGLDVSRRMVTWSDAMEGLRLTAGGLASAAAVTRYAVSDDQHRRRVKIAQDWEDWSASYPEPVRPLLSSCQPAEVICFLEHWRNQRTGKRNRSATGDHLPAIAPTTLRAASGHLSAIMSGMGRSDVWSPDCPRGNPVRHQAVANFLRGYELMCFRVMGYSASGLSL